jgi:hypothetical protein
VPRAFGAGVGKSASPCAAARSGTYLDGPAAILALGGGAFEIAEIERMVFYRDGKALVAGIERRALCFWMTKRVYSAVATATDESLQRIRENLPPRLLELQTIAGQRPASTKLHDLVGVNTPDELAAACREEDQTPGRALQRSLRRIRSRIRTSS